MLELIIALIGFCISLNVNAQNTSLAGKVLDESTGEPVMFSSVTLYQNNTLIKGVETDLDGNFLFENIDGGTYSIEANFMGYQPKRITDVIVYQGLSNILNIEISEGVNLDEICVIGYREPLIIQDNCSQGSTVTSEEIRNLPIRSINGLAATSAGLGSSDDRKTKRKARKLKRKNSHTEVPNPSREDYSYIQENEYHAAKNTPLSTFSIDVDRASYSNIRRFINQNTMPPKDAVRIEEMINYFEYEYPQPEGKEPFSVTTEYADCPWNKKNKILHIGVQGKTIDAEEMPDANLVFLVDVSGSMSSPDKLELVKSSLLLLIEKLKPTDRIALVTYAGATQLVLPPTELDKKPAIIAAIKSLGSGGSTAGASGIKLAYETARKYYIPKGNNRIILATDGDFNVGVSSNAELKKIIEKEREHGIFLSVLGFGTGNYQDSKMQMLADDGNGNHAYIDNIKEAEKVLVKEMAGTLLTIAKDVKIQIEFNPAVVGSYRLIGYENRILAKEDFNNDKKDAGELGAGHTVTAIYEIIPMTGKRKMDKGVDALKYQAYGSPVEAYSGELATVKLRYKKPQGKRSSLLEVPVLDILTNTALTSNNMRWAMAMAQFGLTVRRSKHLKDYDYNVVLTLASSGLGSDDNGYRAEAIQLIQRVMELDDPSHSRRR